MHSRAYLLLKRDIENLKRFPMEVNVTEYPTSEYLAYWCDRG